MGTVEHKVIVRDQATPILKNIGAGFLNLKNIAIGAGIAIATKFGKECVDSAAKLETAFAKVRTIGELTETQMNELVKASIKYGKSAVDAAAGLYDIYSAGHKGAEGMEILNVALKTSVAGFVSVKDAASSIIDVMNAYGEAAGDAARVSEVLLKGVELGKYVFEDYGGQLGRVTSLAKQMGMEFTELIALLDVLTVKGVDFSEAVTQILGIMNAMIKPTDSLKQVFADWGYENAQAAIEAEGFVGVLEHLYELSGKNMNIMGEWIPRVRGLIGFVTALSGEEEKLAEFQKELANSTGVLTEKYEIMANTYEQQMKQLKESIEDVKRSIGESLIPVILDTITALKGMYHWAKLVVDKIAELGSMQFSGIPSDLGIAIQMGKAVKERAKRYEEEYERRKEIEEKLRTIFTRDIQYSAQLFKDKLKIGAGYLKSSAKEAASLIIKSFEALPEKIREELEKLMDQIKEAGEDLGRGLVETLAKVTVPTQRALNLQAEISKYEARIQDLEKRSLEAGLSEAEENLLKKLRDEVSLLKMRSYYGETVKPKTEDISNLLNNILESAKEQKYINEQQLGDIKNGIEIQLRALETREKLKELALEQIKKSDFWGKLTAEQQEKLSSDIGKSMQEYISTTDILLNDIKNAISGLKLSPTIINKIYISGRVEGVENEVIEEGETVTGRSREESLKELSRRAI